MHIIMWQSLYILQIAGTLPEHEAYTSYTYQLADDDSSEEESITAPPYSPLSSRSVTSQSSTVREQEASMDLDDDGRDYVPPQGSIEVVTYIMYCATYSVHA